MVAALVLLLPATGKAQASAASRPDRGVPEAAEPAPDGPSCPDGAVSVALTEELAGRAGVRPGSRLRVATEAGAEGCPAAVAAVFRPRADPSGLTRARPRVVLHLPQLARLLGRPDRVDRFSVLLRPGVAPGAVTSELRSLMPGTRVLATAEVVRESSTTFEVVRRFHRAIGLITVAAGGIFLACIMTLKIRERRVPVATLRLLGVSRRTLLAWLIAEAALIAVLGGLLGIGLGRAAAAVINRYYQGAYETSLTFALVTPGTVWAALGLAVGLGLAAGLAAALPLLSRDPLEDVR